MPTPDWFTKFVRAWAAGFASQVILVYLIGYTMLWVPDSTHTSTFRIGSSLVLFSEIAVLPSAAFTALVALICVMLTKQLKWAVAASATVSFLAMALLFMASGHPFF